MDSEYLKETVGAALSEGLTAVALAQPSDTVEYLGQYLLKYVAVKEKELKAAELQAAAVEEEEKYNARNVAYVKAAKKKAAFLEGREALLQKLHADLEADYTQVRTIQTSIISCLTDCPLHFPLHFTVYYI